MSGIAGIFSLDQDRDRLSFLPRMLSAISHRGSGEGGQWSDEKFSLGQQWLSRSTIERAARPDPIHHRESGLVIAADARLDDPNDLAEQLGIAIRALPTEPAARDAHLILEAYLKWGQDCPNHLEGDFAFAIVDTKSRTLFLARDPFGVRPIVYHFSPGRLFAFASEVKALLSLPFLKHELNWARIGDWFVPWLECYDFESTFFEGIHQFPPGSSCRISIETSAVKPERWFRFDADQPPWRFSSDAEAEEALLAHLRGAIQRRLPDPGLTGTMLSGGLDSSSIAALGQEWAIQQGGKGFTAFAAVSNESPAGPETESIDLVTQATGITTHRISPDCEWLSEIESPEVVAGVDDLFDFSIPLLPVVFHEAASAGYRSILTGVDGDLVMGASHRHLVYLLRSGRIPRAVSELIGLARNTDLGAREAAHLMTFCGASTLFPRWTRQRHRKAKIAEQLNASPLRPEFADRIGLSERIGRLYDRELPEPDFRSLAGRQAHLLTLPLLTNALERYDRSAHRFSVEPTHPFLDRRLVEFCLRLPEEFRIRDGWSKWGLRQAIRDRLPISTRFRKENQNVNSVFLRHLLKSRIRLTGPIHHDQFSALSPIVACSRNDPEVVTESRIDELDIDSLYDLRSRLLLNDWLRGL